MTIVQTPNKFLLLALGSAVLRASTTGTLAVFGETLYIMSIVVWAYLEAADGVNLFRKVLGWGVLIWTFYSLYTRLS